LKHSISQYIGKVAKKICIMLAHIFQKILIMLSEKTEVTMCYDIDKCYKFLYTHLMIFESFKLQ
jgi:hypothetical protein